MPSRRLIKDPERYKTVLCATWASNGECPYGRKCQFAHGKEELRVRNPVATACAPAVAPPGPSGVGAPYTLGAGPQLSQFSQSAGWAMPPLPPGPPPPRSSHQNGPPGSGAQPPQPMIPLQQRPQQQQQQQQQQQPFPPLPQLPPLPPGPLPSAHVPSRPTAYDQAAVSAAFASPPGKQPHAHASLCSSCSPASLSPPMPSVAGGLAGAGPLDCPGALVGPPSLAPPTPSVLPAALVNSAGQGPAAAPGAHRPLGSLGSLGSAAAAPSCEPPLPPPSNPQPSAAGAAASSSGVAGAAAAAPAAAPLSASDELAMYAMNLHLQGSGFLDEACGEIWSPIRSPLKLNAQTGKVEAVAQGVGGRPMVLTHPQLNGAEPPHASLYDVPDSPLEPGLNKREVSFSTQMVRRAVSFIFNEDDANAPARRSPLVHSPHTAIAA